MATESKNLPAEWEKHEATLLAFPYEGKDWPGKYAAIKWVFIEIINKLSRYEKVILLVKSEKNRIIADRMLEMAHVDRRNINYIVQETNRTWMRDSGPIIVRDSNGKREALHYGFNGWAKYSNYKKDQKVPAAVASYLNIPLVPVLYNNKQVVLEGGSIDTNGFGTLITTEECLLDDKIQVRNPGFTRNHYEDIFREYLGIKNIIWLGKGIEGDDTHGHVDDICRFVNRNTVVVAKEENSIDYNYRILKENLERLQQARLENGEKLNTVTIPMPERIDFEGMRLPASYINFIFANGAILVPVFNDKNDYKALGIIKDLFPNHDVIGINSIDLIWGLGTLHCLSREIPV